MMMATRDFAGPSPAQFTLPLRTIHFKRRATSSVAFSLAHVFFIRYIFSAVSKHVGKRIFFFSGRPV